MAQDQLGHGQWSRCDETIPMMEPDDLLAPFELSDPKHPVLVRGGIGNTALEEDKLENASPGSSHELTSDESSSQQSDTGSSEDTCIGVRRAFTDAHAYVLGRNHAHGHDELEHNQKRPNTAP
ncbi:hypothetical protein PG996_013511 [Apiospora saccharicola]|uniref:Uncharacterized protein n=1 Tax=Apiospora saccharicola TaxID=335842 RepID=A0ABR1U5P3_9PEZI